MLFKLLTLTFRLY